MSKLKQHVTPPTVISLIALVFAVSGVSYAATGGGSGNNHSLTVASVSKSKSKGKAGARGPAGPKGATGATGPAGKNGAPGATGPQGPAGANGSSGQGVTSTAFSGAKGSCAEGGAELTSASGTTFVCNGEEGSAGTPGTVVKTTEFTGANGTCKEGGTEINAGKAAATYACDGHEGKNGTFGSEPLPAGQTLKGVWATVGYTAAASGLAESAVSFADPVNSFEIGEEEEYHYIKPGETPPAGCTGNEKEPGAEPGHLCVFGKEESNVAGKPAIKLLSDSTVLGFRLQITSAAQGTVFAQGTWAVTAES